MQYIPWRVAILILLTGASLEAQFQDRLYPFVELTDEMRDRIDLKDGSVDDWLEVLGEPSLTPLDLALYPNWGYQYDPSSFDFRIWLAWHHGSNHLFVAAEMVDDFVHARSNDRFTFGPGITDGDLSLWFYVDGDRSGGSLEIDNASGLTNRMEQAQWYGAFPGSYEDGTNVYTPGVSRDDPDWVYRPPFADGGGAVIDSQPPFGVLEFYVTPFDRLIWDDQDQSIVSPLIPEKMIWFGLSLSDVDEDKWSFESVHELWGSDEWWEQDDFSSSDLWARGILVEAGNSIGDSAVNSVSWAGIKASLSK